ncbi:MAG: hypothetical protein JST46_08285 [Bacteroidetes bacterium]|nr:hypothetical protein [Bacteroidota bacterium]
MKKDWKYILYLTVAFGLYIAARMTEPKQLDWTPTYASRDKNPYGGYALHQLLPSILEDQPVMVSNKTLYELKDSLKTGDNLIILTHSLHIGKQDFDILLRHVAEGATAFVSAQDYNKEFLDTIHIWTSDYLFRNGVQSFKNDTTWLKFVHRQLDSARHFPFRRDNIYNYFTLGDSSMAMVVAENNFHQPVTIRINWGKGALILNSTPLAFTNIYAISGATNEFIAHSLSNLRVRRTHWTEYYSIGRLEASSPLRFILTQEPLAWAYYIALLSLVVFMLFEGKRKQRIIPIIKPLENTSLEFVGTVGNLYYQRGDHRNIAEKMILYFFDQLRARYNLNAQHVNEDFFSSLSGKTGHSITYLRELFSFIAGIREQVRIDKDQLIQLNLMLETFRQTP